MRCTQWGAVALRDYSVCSLGSGHSLPSDPGRQALHTRGRGGSQEERVHVCGDGTWHGAESRAGRGSAQEHPQTNCCRRGCSGRHGAEADGDVGREHMPPTLTGLLSPAGGQSSPPPRRVVLLLERRKSNIQSILCGAQL